MKLKGSMTIELTDSNTGAVKTVTEDNMITEAVNDLFAYNPFGAITRPGTRSTRWSGTRPCCQSVRS